MSFSRVVAIIQARMGSTRLPGKVLADLAGRPLILHVVERVQACQGVAAVVVTIPGGVEDDPLARVLTDAGVSYLRNQRPPDLLAAYVETARELNADVVMRVTGDCPLWAPDVGTWTMEKFHWRPPYAASLEYPGQDVEMVSTVWLRSRHNRLSQDDPAREHGVGLALELQGLVTPVCPWLAVDTAEDLARVRAVHAALDDPTDYTLAATLRAWERAGRP